MKKLGLLWAGFAVCGALGCEGLPSDERSEDVELAATSVAASSDAKLRIERAARALERGDDPTAAKADLTALLDAPGVGPDELDEARLTLSRIHSALGEDEAAIAAVEELLSLRADRDRFPARDAAEKRLRLLLTGAENEKDPKLPGTLEVPPATKALAKLFVPDADGHVLVEVFAFGRGRGDAHGLFDIAEAKRMDLEQDLSSKIGVSQSISSAGSWIALPRAIGEKAADMPQADRSLLVFYYDLGDLRVPSRYDDYLPLPSDEIAAHLQRGHGLVALRRREHGLPTIVIAAPRRAQLDAVEAAFAQMSELPTEPMEVPLAQKLTPQEIQAVVRGAKGEIKACYEAALAKDPKLSGALQLELEIDGAGRVTAASVGESTLGAAVDACVAGVGKGLTFPASGGERVKVTYPLSMTP